MISFPTFAIRDLVFLATALLGQDNRPCNVICAIDSNIGYAVCYCVKYKEYLYLLQRTVLTYHDWVSAN